MNRKLKEKIWNLVDRYGINEVLKAIKAECESINRIDLADHIGEIILEDKEKAIK